MNARHVTGIVIACKMQLRLLLLLVSELHCPAQLRLPQSLFHGLKSDSMVATANPPRLTPRVYLQRNELRNSRMELLAAQDEARLAREEARQFRAELSASQAELTQAWLSE